MQQPRAHAPAGEYVVAITQRTLCAFPTEAYALQSPRGPARFTRSPEGPLECIRRERVRNLVGIVTVTGFGRRLGRLRTHDGGGDEQREQPDVAPIDHGIAHALDQASEA